MHNFLQDQFCLFIFTEKSHFCKIGQVENNNQPEDDEKINDKLTFDLPYHLP